MKLNERMEQYRSSIEQALADYIDQFQDQPQKELYDAIRYSLLGGGKRLRPILTLEFCRMCCGDWERALPFAMAVEMIQTYSLIHDDLPAMDNDDYRRGKLTNHKVYGEAMAILAGDALLTDAFGCIAAADIPGKDIRLAISALALGAGSAGMVGGQVLDIQSEKRQLTEEEVLDVQVRKTGALITAACMLGVIAGGGTEEQQEAAGMFAGMLGIAFQIRDDMLDVIGTQEELGKGVGTDETKNTFVRLFGLEQCEAMVQQYTDAAIGVLSVFDDTEPVIELAKSLTDRTK